MLELLKLMLGAVTREWIATALVAMILAPKGSFESMDARCHRGGAVRSQVMKTVVLVDVQLVFINEYFKVVSRLIIHGRRVDSVPVRTGRGKGKRALSASTHGREQ